MAKQLLNVKEDILKLEKELTNSELLEEFQNIDENSIKKIVDSEIKK